MSASQRPVAAPAERVQLVLEQARIGSREGLEAVDRLMRDFPRDGRLHFLRGSFLASLENYAEARKAMEAAVELAPGFAIARFQLGFLILTSGDPAGAEAVWGPLHLLAMDDPLRLFVRGLGHFIRDEFEPAVLLLREGIARNTQNEPLNRDMNLLIDAALNRTVEAKEEESSVSAAHLLLKQYSTKGPKH
jgi:hypothetical protein